MLHSTSSSGSSSHPCAMQGMRGEDNPGESRHDRCMTPLCLHELRCAATAAEGFPGFHSMLIMTLSWVRR